MAAVLVVGLTFVCSPAVFLLLCLDLWTARCVFRRYVLAAFGRELNAKYPARLFSSRLRLRLWCPAATLGPFSFTLSWPRLFFFVTISPTCPFLSPTLLFTFALAFLSLPAFHLCVISLYFIYSLPLSSVCSVASISHTSLLICSFLSPLALCSHSIRLPRPHLSPFFLHLRLCSLLERLWSFLFRVIDPPVHPFNTLSFCPCSVTREKPPSCCTTFCTRSPSRSSWCPAAAASPRWSPKPLECGTSSWWVTV